MRTSNILSMSFDDAADQVRNSHWFQAATMSVHRLKGYRAVGSFGLQSGVRLTPSAFYASLARGVLALKETGPDCLLATDFGDYRPKSTGDIAHLLAVQYHIESVDNPTLTPRQFWAQHGKELMFHPDLKSVAGGQRMDTLATLESNFYDHCETITLEDLMDLHIDFCLALSSVTSARKTGVAQ